MGTFFGQIPKNGSAGIIMTGVANHVKFYGMPPLLYRYESWPTPQLIRKLGCIAVRPGIIIIIIINDSEALEMGVK